MTFPPSGYTGRGGVAMVDQWGAAQALLAPQPEAIPVAESEPDAPAAITADPEQDATDEISPVAQEGEGEAGEPGQIAA
jgi:ParB family chromosome partitioning protein